MIIMLQHTSNKASFPERRCNAIEMQMHISLMPAFTANQLLHVTVHVYSFLKLQLLKISDLSLSNALIKSQTGDKKVQCFFVFIFCFNSFLSLINYCQSFLFGYSKYDYQAIRKF